MDKSWKDLLVYAWKPAVIWKPIMIKVKKAKNTKGCVIKRELKFQSYENCLKISQIINKVNYLEKKKK